MYSFPRLPSAGAAECFTHEAGEGIHYAASNFVTIRLARGGRINHAFGEVALDRGALALGRRAIAAGAGRDDLEPLAGLKGRVVALKLEPRRAHAAAARAGAAAAQAPGIRAQARQVEPYLAFGFGAIHATPPHPP